VPFIRYSRDARGNENTYVMHAYRPGQGAQQTKVLYLFRSPANIKGVGRKPLDAEVLEALEHTHPDLTFDWTALIKEGIRQDTRERPGRGARRGAGRKTAAKPAPKATPKRAPVAEDQSLLGRVLGAKEAARLRRGHADVLQRIARRARTPEDRDRLTERIARLNPDEWQDETAVTAGAQSIEAEWDAVTAELPARRRGRRGGRRREASGSEPSGIMAESRESHEESSQSDLGGPDRDGDGRGNGGGVGADANGVQPEPPVDVSGDS
jgi:hypothetical protein